MIDFTKLNFKGHFPKTQMPENVTVNVNRTASSDTKMAVEVTTPGVILGSLQFSATVHHTF